MAAGEIIVLPTKKKKGGGGGGGGLPDLTATSLHIGIRICLLVLALSCLLTGSVQGSSGPSTYTRTDLEWSGARRHWVPTTHHHEGGGGATAMKELVQEFATNLTVYHYGQSSSTDIRQIAFHGGSATLIFATKFTSVAVVPDSDYLIVSHDGRRLARLPLKAGLFGTLIAGSGQYRSFAPGYTFKATLGIIFQLAYVSQLHSVVGSAQFPPSYRYTGNIGGPSCLFRYNVETGLSTQFACNCSRGDSQSPSGGGSGLNLRANVDGPNSTAVCLAIRGLAALPTTPPVPSEAVRFRPPSPPFTQQPSSYPLSVAGAGGWTPEAIEASKKFVLFFVQWDGSVRKVVLMSGGAGAVPAVHSVVSTVFWSSTAPPYSSSSPPGGGIGPLGEGFSAGGYFDLVVSYVGKNRLTTVDELLPGGGGGGAEANWTLVFAVTSPMHSTITTVVLKYRDALSLRGNQWPAARGNDCLFSNLTKMSTTTRSSGTCGENLQLAASLNVSTHGVHASKLVNLSTGEHTQFDNADTGSNGGGGTDGGSVAVAPALTEQPAIGTPQAIIIRPSDGALIVGNQHDGNFSLICCLWKDSTGTPSVSRSCTATPSTGGHEGRKGKGTRTRTASHSLTITQDSRTFSPSASRSLTEVPLVLPPSSPPPSPSSSSSAPTTATTAPVSTALPTSPPPAGTGTTAPTGAPPAPTQLSSTAVPTDSPTTAGSPAPLSTTLLTSPPPPVRGTTAASRGGGTTTGSPPAYSATPNPHIELSSTAVPSTASHAGVPSTASHTGAQQPSSRGSDSTGTIGIGGAAALSPTMSNSAIIGVSLGGLVGIVLLVVGLVFLLGKRVRSGRGGLADADGGMYDDEQRAGGGGLGRYTEAFLPRAAGAEELARCRPLHDGAEKDENGVESAVPMVALSTAAHPHQRVLASTQGAPFGLSALSQQHQGKGTMGSTSAVTMSGENAPQHHRRTSSL